MSELTLADSAGVSLSGGNTTVVIIVAVVAIVALAMAVLFRQEVLSAPEGTDNMKTIGQAVEEGAQAYLTRQFKTLAVFAVLAFLLLFVLPGGCVHPDRTLGVLPVRRRFLRVHRVRRHVAGRQGECPGGCGRAGRRP